MTGEIAILNCSDGDTRISFNSDSPDEVERARAVVEDMLRRGYCISVEVGGKMERAVGFDPKTDEYIVESKAERKPRGRPRTQSRRKAKDHKAVSVGMTAGGGFGGRHFGLTRAVVSP